MAARGPTAKTPTKQPISSSPAPLIKTPGAVAKSPGAVLKSLSASLRSPGFSLKTLDLTRSGSEGCDDIDDNFEEVAVGKLRGAPMVWKIIGLIVLAGMGLYVCMSSVSYNVYSNTLGQESQTLDLRNDAEVAPRKGLPIPDSCPKLPAVKYPDPENIGRHYPRPKNYTREECQCTPVHNFVILSMQRSGSGWFETLLNYHPNISSHGEIFSVRPRRQNFSTIQDTLEAVYNLDWVSSAAKKTCTQAVGLKWMLNQGAMEYHREVEAYFREQRVSIILLLRRNLLKRLISILANAYDRKMRLLNGEHKSHVHSEDEAKKLAEFKPQLNTKHLIGNLQRVQDIADDALRVFNTTRMRVVYYEDVVKDRQLLAGVQEFLGVPVQELTSKQVKIHTKPLREQVDNWEEVRQRLNGTEFEKFVADTEDR